MSGPISSGMFVCGDRADRSEIDDDLNERDWTPTFGDCQYEHGDGETVPRIGAERDVAVAVAEKDRWRLESAPRLLRKRINDDAITVMRKKCRVLGS